MNNFFLEKRFVYQRMGQIGNIIEKTPEPEAENQLADRAAELRADVERMCVEDLMGNRFLDKNGYPTEEWFNMFERLEHDQAVTVLQAFEDKPDSSYWQGYIAGFYGKEGSKVEYEMQLTYYHSGYLEGNDMAKRFKRRDNVKGGASGIYTDGE